MISARRVLGVVIVSALCAFPLGAQSAVLTGTVVRDSSGAPIADVEIAIPSLNRSTRTNYLGEFRLSALPAGAFAVVVRLPGFAALTDSITFAAGARVDREFSLRAQAVALDTVRTSAREQKYISPNLRDFEERRTSGRGGYFVSDSMLRKEQNRPMLNILMGYVPGLTRVRVQNKYYVGTARKCAPGPEFLKCKGGPSACPVTLYVDGVRVYDAVNSPLPSDVPDLGLFRPEEYAGIEYYPGGASLPAKYSASSSGCGVLLLGSRER
jgi:hypothetical protein